MADFRGEIRKARVAATAPNKAEIPLNISLQPLRSPSVTFAPVGAGATIYVPTGYPTIQQAIDTATDGDTIYVYNGTYNESLTSTNL